MAKKAKTDLDFLKEIAESSGGQTLEEAGVVPHWIDSGNLAVNWQMSGRFIGGGFPGGRIIESFGEESSGKSLLGYCFLGAVQRMGGIAVHFDCERASGAEFAERCGHVDPRKLLTYYPITLEDVERHIYKVVRAIREHFPDHPIGFVWDSIGVNCTDREWNETNLPENPTAQQIKDAGGHARPGERAKVSNAVLRKINPFLNKNGATLYVVNQVRKKIGVIIGSDETTSGGGEALKFYASLRLRCGRPKEFIDKKTKMPLGVNMKVKNRKNRHFTPGLLVENVPLYFASGIHPTGGLLTALVQSGRVEGKTNYKVCEPYAGGEEITFRAALKDPLDPEVLYRCPALVDVTSSDEVKDYLSEWQGAIQVHGTADEVTPSDEVAHLLGGDDDE